MCDTCVVFKNLFNYDRINRIPTNFPKGVDPVYITDSGEEAQTAKTYGWNVYITDMFKHKEGSFEKRMAIAFINCYPERVVPELSKYTYIFVCDSNVTSFDPDYTTFINRKTSEKAFYMTTGWYSGSENTIYKELQRSLQNGRWSYNFDNMKNSTMGYIRDLTDKGIDESKTPVASAKYIGWNIRHPFKNTIADAAYKEYLIHLQGNIIFSYLLHIYPNYIEHYINSFARGTISHHLLQY